DPEASSAVRVAPGSPLALRASGLTRVGLAGHVIAEILATPVGLPSPAASLGISRTKHGRSAHDDEHFPQPAGEGPEEVDFLLFGAGVEAEYAIQRRDGGQHRHFRHDPCDAADA